MDVICAENAAISHYFWLNFVNLVDIIFSLSSLIVEIALLVYVKRYKIYCHSNFRIIAASICSFFAVHAFCILLVQLFHQFQWRFGGPCGAVLLRYQCLMFRAPTLVAVIGFSFNHLLFFLDRALATLKPLVYEKQKTQYGIMGVIVTWWIAIGLSFYTFYDNEMLKPYPYCIVTAQASGPRLQMIYLCQIGFNLCVLLGDAALKKLGNRRAKIRDRNISPGRYALGEQIQLRENQITTAWLFPFATLHTTVFLVFLILTTTYRTMHTDSTMTPQHVAMLEALHLLVCMYAFGANIVNFCVYIKLYNERQMKAEIQNVSSSSDIYFQMFVKQLEVPKIV
uniref:G_PROTEIN_RECEP_F1_2 domain-containing protein n=1 Tax=Panagrellus redivivus TaxID=6233 RepID=A0A7E4ZV24_PANRE